MVERDASTDVAANYAGAQAGDITHRDIAGGNIVHEGLSVADVGALLNQMQEWRAKDRAYEADKLALELRRQERERQERELRQALLDSRLNAMSLQIAETRRWIIGLLVVVIVALAFIGLLLYERYVAAALIRYWLGAGLGLAAALARVKP